ncbi:hypothetical protein BOTCAL_0277g00070 [Botryotinia calthae]|uniref:Uncharacterized protein n=1 Tax=Botryotinia calthae TaxID=38488 RepID=A0A4Y8CY14_9HELO|nr:hypothetical protein BOTCAL_0277g00070 [Botryotinia calthae]
MSMASPNVISMEQHLTVLHQVVQSANPPSYEEEIHLPSYEEATRDLPPRFPVSVLKLEQVIKHLCSSGDLAVAQVLRIGENVLDLDVNIEQTLIHACAIFPITHEIFTPYLRENRVYLCMRGLQWSRIMQGSEDTEWGVERTPMNRATRMQVKKNSRNHVWTVSSRTPILSGETCKGEEFDRESYSLGGIRHYGFIGKDEGDDNIGMGGG